MMMVQANYVEAAAIGDRLRGITSIIGQLGKYDWRTVKQIFDLMEGMQNAKTLEEKVRFGILVLKQCATLTETTVDDKVMELLDRIVTDDLIHLITPIVQNLLGQEEPMLGTATVGGFHPFAVAARERRIDWANLLQIAIQLLPLLQGVLK